MTSVYDYPKLYDLLFSDLCRAETAFLTSVFFRYFKKSAGTVLEPACGSGRLLFHLAKKGFDVSGLDLNPNAVNYCNKRLLRHGLRGKAVTGNMADFSLSTFGRRKKFDLAFNFVSSFLHLTEEADARSHLRCVAEVLKPGGLYLLGIHLKPRNHAVCVAENWSIRRGLLSVKSLLRTTAFDKKNRTETVEFCIDAETPTKHEKIADQFPLRTYTVRQFDALLADSGQFRIEETFSFLHEPIRVNSSTEDVIFILRAVPCHSPAF
ncbi:MAG: class I SAM-dependent methyltransferase [Planctomycetaceae bacterium]|nr:class I SAM-dependent methyltransferase [Planctomycetaceae bacterium]